MTTVSGDDALHDFRSRLTGRYGLDLVREHGGHALVQLPVGVGKSRWLDAVTVEAVASGSYDLVVVLCPTRRLIDERVPLRRPPPRTRVVNLRPRPAERCGPERDRMWKRYEQANLGALGRVDICGHCPHQSGCFWPRQYGKALQGASIVYATQAHLKRSPSFLASLRGWTKAKRILTLLDEISFVVAPFERVINIDTLARFADTLRHATASCRKRAWKHDRWLALVRMLQDASTCDLQDGGWRAPFVHPQWACEVQRIGLDRHGDTFVFPAFDLLHFGHSPVETRLKADSGDIQFSIRPYLGDCMIFSAAADPKLTRYRLGKDIASPFSAYRFVHPDTRWYNLASPIGSRKYFERHSPQVLDFFAQLVARRAADGKRVLLVAKKCFAKLCAAGLAKRFCDLGVDLRVITGDFSTELLADPRNVVPLINYGMIGTNLFEHFDAVYCLTGYYVNEPVVNRCLQDMIRQDLRLPIIIETVGVPRRRRARLVDPDHRYYDTAEFLQPALELQEHQVVVQAAGRVRPFTLPREVITFQMGELPGVRYDAEFCNLSEARRFFEVATGRDRKRSELARRIAAVRAEGKTQAETALILGVTEKTVRNYERKGGPEKSHL